MCFKMIWLKRVGKDSLYTLGEGETMRHRSKTVEQRIAITQTGNLTGCGERSVKHELDIISAFISKYDLTQGQINIPIPQRL